MSDMTNPIVTITMENGAVMTGELYPAKAPNTVANFISLPTRAFMTAWSSTGSSPAS